MIRTPYETTACKHYLPHIQNDVASALAKALSIGDISETGNELCGNLVVVTGLKTPGVKIPRFQHPVEFETVYGQKRVAIDARGVTNQRVRGTDPVVVRNTLEFNLLIHRAILQKAWNEEAYSDIKHISPIPHALFTRWVSETLARKYQLQPEIQLKLAIVTAFHWLCQFIPKEVFDPKELIKHATQVARATGSSLESVEEVIKDLPHLETAEEFISCIRDQKWTVRLDQLEVGIYFRLLTMSWTGAESQELIAVALEHPVTFVTVVYEAICNQGYKKTRLGDLLYRHYDKSDNFKQFVLNYGNCLKIWRS